MRANLPRGPDGIVGLMMGLGVFTASFDHASAPDRLASSAIRAGDMLAAKRPLHDLTLLE
jgi:hypothetical protein